MSHLTSCPRLDKSLKCPCKEGPSYCCKECQVLHWGIHKITCDANGRSPKSKSMSVNAVNKAMMKYQKETDHLVRNPSPSPSVFDMECLNLQKEINERSLKKMSEPLI